MQLLENITYFLGFGISKGSACLDQVIKIFIIKKKTELLQILDFNIPSDLIKSDNIKQNLCQGNNILSKMGNFAHHYWGT